MHHGKTLNTQIRNTAMTTKQKAVSMAAMEPDGLASLIEQYGCGPVEFAGTDEAFTSGTCSSITSSN